MSNQRTNARSFRFFGVRKRWGDLNYNLLQRINVVS